MNALNGTILIGLCLLSGAVSGYFAARVVPSPAQIAVVDIQSLVSQSLSPDGKQTEAQATNLTQKVKTLTDKLVANGIVVLDAQAVLNAPEAAYVRIE